MKIFKMLTLIFLCSCLSKPMPAVVDGDPVPPEPDEKENNKTIAGVDVDKDGVRDDLERWINQEFDDPNVRNALKQYVRYNTLVMEASQDREESIRLIRKRGDSSGCLHAITEDVSEDIKILKKLEVRQVNSESRLRAYLLADAHFGGQRGVSKSMKEELKDCEFEMIKNDKK